MNGLLECAEPLFKVIHLFQNASMQIDLNYKNKVKLAFESFECQSINNKISQDTVREGKYAFSACIDEMVLTSEWNYRYEWAKETLQLEYFKEHTAGEEFFEHLSQLQKNGSSNLDILEIYYACLVLGFKGKYQRLGDEKWRALRNDLKNQIDKARIAYLYDLTPNVLENKQWIPSKWSSVQNRTILFGGILIFLCIYVLGHWRIS